MKTNTHEKTLLCRASECHVRIDVSAEDCDVILRKSCDAVIPEKCRKAAHDTVNLDEHELILAFLEIFSDETPSLTKEEEKEKDALYNKIIVRHKSEVIPTTPPCPNGDGPACRHAQRLHRRTSVEKNPARRVTFFSLILTSVTFGLVNFFGESSNDGKSAGQPKTVS